MRLLAASRLPSLLHVATSAERSRRTRPAPLLRVLERKVASHSFRAFSHSAGSSRGDGQAESTSQSARRRRSAKEVVEEGITVIKEMIGEYSSEVFLQQGLLTATSDAELDDAERAAVLRSVVAARLDRLDESFLAVLSGYIATAAQRGETDLLQVLLGIREEVLAAVGAALPPEVQLVELLSTLRRAQDRADVLRLAAQGGGEVPAAGSAAPLVVPGCPLAAAENAASRIIEQMEDRDARVVDWPLLARVCLVREAARCEVRPGALPPGKQRFVTAAFPPGSLPAHESSLLKELLTIGDVRMRAALLSVAFDSARKAIDNEAMPGGGGLGNNQGSVVVGMGSAKAKAKAASSSRTAPPVRPGRFLDCVANAQAEIMRAEGLSDEALAMQDPIFRRMTGIHDETVEMLERIAEWGG